ncbi:nicotinamide-nucleotide amidohydrolase family protein [Fluviicola sp.]|uniref:CinA family protein n=1 Tax=Fluviicola sp. TaxID=1917219 RepID=UPI0031DB1A49
MIRKKANALIQQMQKEGLTLALAESMTCGLAAAKLSSCIGVSDVLLASIVCYTPKAKIQLLQVKQATIRSFTCESAEVTRQMAENLSERIAGDVYAAITGLASSDGSETKEKPVGTVFYAIRYQGRTYDFRKVFHGTPLEIKKKAVIELYGLILKLIKK